VVINGAAGWPGAANSQRIEYSRIGISQGEDSFLDSLDEPWRTRCWETLAERSRDVSAFVAPSQYYAGLMSERMKLRPEQVRVIGNGVAHTEFAVGATSPEVPTIGYLARMVANKGLGTVVDAFILLKKRGHIPKARLIVAGAMTAHDEHYVESLKQKINSAGCHDDVSFGQTSIAQRRPRFCSSLP
jgi:glycosyltransferase involved in cell wall biosynthesis